MKRDVEGDEARTLLEKEEVFILDVRTPQEFQSGHFERATLIPVAELQNRIDELPKDLSQSILVYCAHGIRSQFACSLLENHGYQNVINLRGGIAHLLGTE